MCCGTTQERIAALLAGGLSERERLDVESHTARCARCATAYHDLVATSVAVERAYATLRLASTTLSPARVRLALRIVEPTPMVVRFNGVMRRVNEVALAAAVTAFAFVGAGSVGPKTNIVDEAVPQSETVVPSTHVSARSDEQHFLRWFRIGRYAPSADLLDAAVSPRVVVDETPVTAPERAGLAR